MVRLEDLFELKLSNLSRREMYNLHKQATAKSYDSAHRVYGTMLYVMYNAFDGRRDMIKTRYSAEDKLLKDLVWCYIMTCRRIATARGKKTPQRILSPFFEADFKRILMMHQVLDVQTTSMGSSSCGVQVLFLNSGRYISSTIDILSVKDLVRFLDSMITEFLSQYVSEKYGINGNRAANFCVRMGHAVLENYRD